MKLPYFFVLICCLALGSCSLDIEEEEKEENQKETNIDDESVTLIDWSGETDKFTITAQKGVQLDDPAEMAGTAYLTFANSNIRNTRWEFGVRLTFNPSANNYARYYLAASSANLNEALDGYYIQIGGAKDNVTLHRQHGTESVLLASGRNLMEGNNSPKLYVKVECDPNGIWTFWTRLETEQEYTLEKRIKDTSFQSSACSGIYCVYTKSRCKGFTFHHIRLSNDVEESDDSELPDRAEFPEDIYHALLFNEIMYDNAANGANYIELYNPSEVAVAIPSLKLLRYVYPSKDSDAALITTEAILQPADESQKFRVPPHGYICITPSAKALIDKHKGNADKEAIVEAKGFPMISTQGGYLIIAINEDRLRPIDVCGYSDSMHAIPQRQQGISLEKRSPELSSKANESWTSSQAATGGTPGRKNSQE